jgi:ABC-type Fe3+/spermidine/putrescine transport system ATPase subunit
MPPAVRFVNASRHFGAVRAVDAVTLDIEEGEFFAMLGPSGSGKTTCLRLIAGFEQPDEGHIEIFGEPAEGVPPYKRNVNSVFQDYALFPHMSVRRNIEYAGRHRADAYLERFEISHLADEPPTELSGGERQRVALARALARDPAVLLLDEPLSALDAHTKSGVRAELQRLLRELGLPAILVTHDFEDAAALADRVGVLVDGKLRQFASPQELVSRPRDAFVASFTGANLLHGTARPIGDDLTGVRLESGETVYSTDLAEGAVGVVVYPWDVSLARLRHEDSAMNSIRGEIGSLVGIGNRVRVSVGPITADVTTASAERLELARGGQAFATFKATATRLVQLA